MLILTIRAACRRFARHHRHSRYVVRLTPRESVNLHGATFALMENNTIRDAGCIETVERWCREAGVMADNERLQG